MESRFVQAKKNDNCLGLSLFAYLAYKNRNLASPYKFVSGSFGPSYESDNIFGVLHDTY